ncbi:LpqB family beta-propeller domain-containing protein [Sphingomonas sp. OK281]|uniref:S41 family peptidase n=1 Tax=Sphingomonas sp. OK281 TaxID=1881067 RepID=UPI000B86F66D|nr:LpqB family beta-propeller domain-containing protein [Sphingomonas sp. OK281]
MLRLIPATTILMLLTVANTAVAAPSATLMRFPTVSADRIAFVARGALWTVSRGGGLATRLTDGSGQVMMPRFSPDGRSIAFTLRQGGASDVYLVPATGGPATRLTHGPSYGRYDNMVSGWTPDGSRILFISARRARFHSGDTTAFSVAEAGGLADRLPIETAGLLSYAPDGHAIAFDRTYRTFGGDRWKRYVGGQAPEIYLYDFVSARQERLTNWRGADTAPMWIGRRVYFLSDRDAARRLNLWVTDLDTHLTRQLTHFADFDIDVPAAGAGAIAFQQAGRLWLFDLVTERLREVSVSFPTEARTVSPVIAAGRYLRASDVAGEPDQALSTDGRTAIVSARGDLFALGADGTARDLTNMAGSDEDHPAISSDGKMLAFVGDVTGEQQIATMPVAGGPPLYLTHFDHGTFYTPRWSPDDRLLAVADGEHGLWLIRADGGGARRVALDPFAEIHDAAFSPDSRLLAYSTIRPSQMRALHLLDLATDRDTIISSPMENDREPAFSADGRYLLFVSQRRELPVPSDRDRETDIATFASDGLYLAPLAATTRSPFAPGRTEAGAARGVDPAGLMARAVMVPVAPGRLSHIEIRGSRVFYRAAGIATIGGERQGGAA